MMDGGEFMLHREMGCTREEFVRWLPGATRHPAVRVEANRAAVPADGGLIEISFVQEPSRTIGRIFIPVLKVTFRFLRVGAAARREFMAHFDLYTRRGGG